MKNNGNRDEIKVEREDLDPERFCPFGAVPVPGSLGKVTILRTKCDLAHCKLAEGAHGACALSQLPELLRRLTVALETIAKEMPALRRN